MASPRSIQVEANSSTLPKESSTGEARDTSVCSPNTESVVALQHSGSGVTPTAGEGRTFSSHDWNMLVMECSSLAAKWRMVSTCLGLPKDMVDQIEADHSKSVERCWSEAIGKWIQQNAPADEFGLPSWSTLLKAIVMVDPHLARKLAVKYQCSLEEPASQSPQAIDENALDLRHKVITEDVRQPLNVSSTALALAPVQEKPAETGLILRKMKSSFSATLTKVRSALEMQQTNPKDVREFLFTYFEGECSIPDVTDMRKIFESITAAKLWKYEHYGPLEDLAENFLPDDSDPARMKVTEYVRQFSAFSTTTSIIDFVKANEFEYPDEDNQLFSPKKYNRSYRKITFILKLEDSTSISEMTLADVHKLWIMLKKKFHLPSLTAVIDKIVQGSLEITWLVLPHTVEKIKATIHKSLDFLQQHNIIGIDLYGGLFTLYDEAWFEGSTSLYRACFTSSLEEVKRLLDGGANINEQNNNDLGETPLIGACRTGDMDTVTLLLEYSPNVNFQDKYGETALMTASIYSHTKVIKVLLEYRALVNKQSKYGTTALMIACQFGDAAMVKMLVEHGATIDHRDKDGVTALMNACLYGNIENVEILLQCGAVVDLTNDKGMTALLYATSRGQTDCARALLQAKAQVNLKDNGGVTALWWACDNNHSETAKLLINFGANVNLPFDREDGGTVLSLACWKGHTQLALLLIAHGTIVDHQNKYGQSPLHLAATGEHVETVKNLLENNVRVNLQDEDGWTAVFVAAEQGHYDIVKQLLEHGADPNIPSKTGLTALDVTRSESHHTVCQILEAHGAKVNTQLTEEQRKEVKSVGEKIWSQVKRMFLRDLVKKEEETGISPHAIGQTKGRSSLGGRFLPKRLRNLFKV